MTEDCNKDIHLLLDTSINDINFDKFGHQHYAEILYSLITNENYKSPYNIGLLGKWGVGKSSIKDLCKTKLDINKSNNVYCIDFDAWKYGGEGVKRALLKYLYTKLGGNYQNFLDEVSRQVQSESKIFEQNKEIVKHMRNIVNTPILVLLSITTIIFTVTNILLNFINAPSWIYAITNTGISVILGIGIALFKNIPFFQNINKIDLPKATAEEFEELLKGQIKKFIDPNSIENFNEKRELEALIKKLNLDINKKFKILIFVDDLDRLPSKEMVDGINAIRTFMDLELPEQVDIVFVISCCENKIAEALESINFPKQNNGCSDNGNDIDKKIEAKRFLDKIFQFRVDIPPFPYQDMIEYARYLFKSQMDDSFAIFEEELDTKGINIENLLCRLIHPKVQSPRQVIQIINAFLQSWWIAKKREGAMKNQIGGLASGSVTNHPLTLAILSVLKVDFPYFYQHLQHEPNLLRFLLDITSKNQSEIFIEQKLKEEFTELTGNNIESGRKIKAKYYELELYLKSIGSRVKLPKSLKALLLLSQDPITRQCGDAANDIQEALSLNDKERLISLFSLSQQQKLTKEQASLLRSVSAEINYETYRINAYHTIINLIDFISDNTNFLLDDITNYIIDNKAFRDELTLEKYDKILSSVNRFKQNDILTVLKDKFLNPHRFTPPYDDEDQYTQDEICENFEKAAKVLLNFYSNNRSKEDKDFFSWIVKPYIGTFADDPEEKGKEQYLSFKFTEECMAKHKFLLNYIGKEYSQKLLKELEKPADEEDEATIEINKSFENIREYLDLIKENNNAELQETLGEYISSKSIEAFEFGFNYLKENLDKFNNEAKDYCLFYLFNTISNEVKENKLYATGINSDFVNYTVAQAKENIKILEDDTIENVEELAIKLGQTDLYIDKSIELYELLKNENKNVDKIREFYIKTAYKSVNESNHKNKLRIYLAQNFEQLSQAQKQQIILNIEKVTIPEEDAVDDDTVLAEEEINLFKLFTENLPEPVFNKELSNPSESIGYLFDKLFDFLLSNTSEGYFMQVFPLLIKNLKYNNSPKLASVLWDSCQKHMSTELATPYGEFYNLMHNHWNDLNQNIWAENNNAQSIYDFTIQSLSRTWGVEFGSELYDSIKQIQTIDNLKKLFDKAYKLKENIIEISNILVKYDENLYSIEEIAAFGGVIEGDEQKEKALKLLWSHWLKMLEDEDIISMGKTIISNIEIYKIYSNCVRDVKKSSTLLIKVIKDILNSEIIVLLQLITTVPKQFEDLFTFGDERKTLALIFIENLPNISDDNSAKIICGFAKTWYTTINKEKEFNRLIRKFKKDSRIINILSEVFPDDSNLNKVEGETQEFKE